MKYRITGKRLFHADGTVWGERGDIIEIEQKHARKTLRRQRNLVEALPEDSTEEPAKKPAKKKAKKKAAKKKGAK